MPPRSAVSQLPEDVRSELDQRLIQGGFSGYDSLSDWLTEQGFAISKSSLHRYGQAFEDRVSALKMASEQAKAIVEASPDDEGAVSEALMRLVQEKLFNILLDFEVTDPSKLNLGSIAKAIASLGRTSVAQKKWALEVRDKAEAAANAAEAIGRKGGLSADSIQQLRKEILGIAS